ncbi:hypothetical protein Tco_0282726 [Tanacetum coccineum]
MVALLEKTDGSEGFYQIVDFINASHIRFALSKNPTIYDSHIKQFWQTATVNTLDNGEQEITTIVDGHVKTITIAYVRKYLKLADAGGLSSLPNTEIFDQLSLMGTFVSTASTQRHTDTTTETLMEIKKSAAKTKELAQKLHKEKQARFNAEQEAEFDAELQAGEKCSEEDLPMKLVDLFNQRKKFFAQQRAEAKRNKPMTPAQQKEYMSNYIKNQELEIQKLKRAGQEVLEEPAKRKKIGEALEEVYVEALQVKYTIIDREVYTKESRKYWKIIRAGNYKEAYQDFADILKKFDRDDLMMVILYGSFKEKDYPLSKALMMLMLVAKLSLEQSSEMANELLRKIFTLANSLRQ